MQSHRDDDNVDREGFKQAISTFRREILEARAKFLKENKASEIASGGIEDPLAHWVHKRLHVKHLPNDPQDILRISIGGRPDIIDYDTCYCTFRGDRQRCIELLKHALAALRAK